MKVKWVSFTVNASCPDNNKATIKQIMSIFYWIILACNIKSVADTKFLKIFLKLLASDGHQNVFYDT